ncbi:hypothetical protein F0344_04870 [Streptomyces finlayi]|uniref:Uncharacterized protein n=2 Tax=Streptomyces finlayi TaxID=67296 RepID=A0A7G7BUQ7_9ACTN|nr:hypothetical protein F0344_04870 [Streptomyces finlayi]
MQVTNETKAVLIADKGRVVGFVKSNEPGKISLAVPADRAVMTPAQARQLAAWLIGEAEKTREAETQEQRAKRLYGAAEARRQAEIRATLGGYPRRGPRAF